MFDLKELGLTEEKMQQLVTDKIVDRLMLTGSPDEDGYEWARESDFARELEKRIKEAIDHKVEQVAETHVKPMVEKQIEELVIHETNRYGETKGESLTFTEYMAKRAEDYMHEDVDHWGKKDSFDRRRQQPRLANMVDQYLHTRIEAGVKEATSNLSGEVGKAISETVKLKLAEVAKSIKVDVKSRN